MAEVWHCDIKKIKEKENFDFFSALPLFMRNDILRYHFERDRKLRIIARFLIQLYLQENNFPVTLDNWKTDSKNKPYIEGGPYFNISHSSDKVVVAFDTDPLGIDVERIDNKISNDMIQHFAPGEIDYINRSDVQYDAFFRIWSRKEAYFKAIGDGIVKGISRVSVVNDEIEENNKKWFLKEVNIDKQYSCHVCIRNKPDNISIVERLL